MDLDPEIYCPICARTIIAYNIDEVKDGYAEYYTFLHDAIPHDYYDLEALEYGIQ